MSRVFLADDLTLERQVVVKVLPPEMAIGVSSDRFRREMQLVARLQHPHIVPILSAGSAGDLLYYIMPFIQGESLRARLARDVAIPVEETARILREVADALAFAHAQGVVHRDIKPDNVMLTSGHALVTDFGVAKALGAGSGQHPVEPVHETEGLTSVGLALGTPTYMAPEQAAADPRVDHRADIYALGVMAYEMLAGQPPFIAPTSQALLAAHVTREPESLRISRPSVPEAFDTLVMRCLAKRPPDRYQQAAELLPLLDLIAHPSGAFPPTGVSPAAAQPSMGRTALLFLAGSVVVVGVTFLLWQVLGLPDWVVSAAVVLLVVGFPIVLRAARSDGTATGSGPLARLRTVRGALAAGGLAFLGLATATGLFMGLRALGIGPFATLLSAGTITERDRVLVAEFTNTTPDTLLPPALTEALTIDLSQSRVIRLMSPTEVQDALGRMRREAATRLTPDIAREVAAREGVKVIVAGDIAPFAGGYTVSARVINPEGTTLFATRATADGASGIIPALETVSKKLREGIGESLRSIRSTQSLEQVTTTSLEALQLYSRATQAKEAGKDSDQLSLYRQAVAIDSNFAMAWRGIASILINSWGDVSAIMAAAERAYQLRDRLPAREALHTETLYLTLTGEIDQAIDIYRRMVATWPDDRRARNGLGLYLRGAGQYADAERVLAPAVDSGTASASFYYNLLATQIPQERFEAADRTLQLMRKRFPDTPMQWQLAFFLAAATYRFDAALAAADSLTRAGEGYRYWGHLHRLEIEQLRGRLKDGDRTAKAANREQLAQGSIGGALRDEVTSATTVFRLTGDTVIALRRLRAALAAYPLDSQPVASRPYGDIVRHYAMLGRLDDARAVQAQYVALTPASFRKGDARGLRGDAALALAEDRPREAIPLASRAAYVAGCDGCTGDMIAQAYERLGEPDSAIAAYERVLRPPAYGAEFWDWRQAGVPLSYYRLGELYEQQGQPVLARDRYASFVDLWQDADPVLQPAVAEAKRRMQRLAGEK